MFGSPLYCPLGLRETPYTTFSGLPPSISEHTAFMLPWKGGYPQLQRRGYHSFPWSSGDISISHLGVNRGYRNVPHTSHCLSRVSSDSSGLRRPPSRTLLLYNGSFLQDPHSPDNPTTQYTLILLMEICTPQCVNFTQTNTVNSDKSRNHINLRNIHIIRLLYHIT